MPWTTSSGPTRHTRKANTPRKKRQWRDVANSAMQRGASEGSAIRQANAAVARNKSRSKRTHKRTKRRSARR